MVVAIGVGGARVVVVVVTGGVMVVVVVGPGRAEGGITADKEGRGSWGRKGGTEVPTGVKGAIFWGKGAGRPPGKGKGEKGGILPWSM